MRALAMELTHVTSTTARAAAVPRCIVRLTTVVVLALAVMTVTTRSVAAPADGALTLVGARVVQADGTLRGGLAVVISGERIERFARPDEEDLPGRIDLPPGSVVSPGLIDLCSSIGAAGETLEIARPVDPRSSPLAAIDPRHRDLRTAVEAGITSAMVCPSPANVVSGTAVTFRTLPRGGDIDVVRDDGPIVFALGDSVLRPDRAPTSRSGAVSLLRETLATAGNGSGSARVSLFLDGTVPGIVFCSDALDVRGALAVFGAAGRVPAIVYSPNVPLAESRRMAKSLVDGGIHLITGPLDLSAPDRELRGPAAFHEAGVPVALAGRVPTAAAISPRLSAALAVRAGLDPAVARRAITSTAAAIAGVSERIGSIEPGKEADVVVFSGDPLRLESDVLAVYVRGTRVYSREEGFRDDPGSRLRTRVALSESGETTGTSASSNTGPGRRESVD